MDTEPHEHLTHVIRNLDLGGNNGARPQTDIHDPPSLFCHLNDADQERLLREAGYLYEFFVDDHEGPRISTRQVAKHKNSQQLSNFIQEQNNMITKVLETETDRDFTFAHQGWSASSKSVITPWIASRIAKHNRAPKKDSWVTKRIVVQRLSVDLTLLDLEPVPEFEGAVLAALGKPSKFQRFQALDAVFRVWGDVVPLAFDLGTSLSMTDRKENPKKISDLNIAIGPHHLTAFGTAQIDTQGGEANFLPGVDANSWLRRAVQPREWSQVRVAQVTPVIDLLKPEIQSQIVGLYSTLLSYCPPSLATPVPGIQGFDSSDAHGLKTISSLSVYLLSGTLHTLVVNYLDETHWNGWRIVGSEERVFELNHGEHITEVMVWASLDCVCAVQFTTSHSRVSTRYGGESGTPTIMSAEDGVLVALAGSKKSDSIYQIQTMWRHDVLKTSPSQNNIYFKYFGGSGGRPFNDRGFIKSPETHISSIRIRSSTRIDAIQVTYSNDCNNKRATESAPWHGESEGEGEGFQLEPGEYIIRVQGRHSNIMAQLCFITNKGRISKVLGGSEGEEFCCEPPQRQDGSLMRLSYIAGKHGCCIDGLLFVWAAVIQGV